MAAINGGGLNGNGGGATPTEHYRNLDDPLPGSSPQAPEQEAITVVIQEDADKPPENIGIEQADGSLIIRLDGRKHQNKDPAGAKVHDANLAEYIDINELGRICDELLNGIDADLQSRQDWIDRRAAGIKHLALKVENPRSPSADADTAVEGQATIRSPIMLDAVMRFQANARGELLPAGGPCKINNTTPIRTPAHQALLKQSGAKDDSDVLAEVLESLFNRYLTVVDKEYYPDTNRMFFMQGFGGCGFKKVYRCPIRRRPVSKSVDADDIIVSDNEVSLTECGRVTHRIPMRQSWLRRMQLAGTYLDMDIMSPAAPDPDEVERAEKDVAGLSVYSTRPDDYKHTIYECYCELDIAGFEHKEKGKITGLPLPYRVTIDKDSQTVLEVRRNWRRDDDRYLVRMPIVKYPFVEGLGFYGIGLLNIMGNATAAATTAWRLALDSAAFSSWPGFLYSETVGRQDTMSFRVGLGSGVKINTGGQPIGQNVMPLPYKDVTTGLITVTQHIEEEARRVGGTPELMVGEGRADVPVGTTLAMLDQAVKVLDSVHKGMHIAQAEEFSLLRDLFIEDPDALICSDPSIEREWQKQDLVRALKTCNLSPQADPNTPSHTIRVMKAVALVQLATLKPDDYDSKAVARRVSTMVGLGNIDDLFAEEKQQGMDPKIMKDMAEIQLKTKELVQKQLDSQTKAQLELLKEKMDMLQEYMKLTNNREERQSREKIEAAKMAQEQMNLAEGALIHPLATPVAEQFVRQWPQMIAQPQVPQTPQPQRPSGRII
jgi:hypothetical protein